MLYVFLVDTGCMLTFDMNVALENVSQLKHHIWRACRIQEDKQVLLISGGESLDLNCRVCSYSAGTDTNPIFLFSKNSIENSAPPAPSVSYSTDTELIEKIQTSLNMPPNYNTVVVRAQIAQQCHEVARDEIKMCESLVHDQHLQQQGWAAVVANLEDITSAFRARYDSFEANVANYLQHRETQKLLLANFQSDLELLKKIPILSVLLSNTESSLISNLQGQPQLPSLISGLGAGDTDGTSDATTEEETSETQSTTVSIYDWLNPQGNMDQIGDICRKGLDQFAEEAFESLRADVSKAIEAVDNPGMKEIKGLEERLYGLEQLMCDAKRIVQEQADLAQAFLQNQNRASNLGDPSILPDLCTSHCRQLAVMLKNQHQLNDIRRRCVKAKEELSTNLHARLKWITWVEHGLWDMDNKLVIYIENIKRLRRYLDVVQQVHFAPELYAKAVVECVRRREFSQRYLQWGSELSAQSSDLYKRELERRKVFHSQLLPHFLMNLFQGMSDQPSAFATKEPTAFDTRLPRIEPGDIEQIRQRVPELADLLLLPQVDTMPLPVRKFASCTDVSMAETQTDNSATTSSFVQTGPSQDNANTDSVMEATIRDPTAQTLTVQEFASTEFISADFNTDSSASSYADCHGGGSSLVVAAVSDTLAKGDKHNTVDNLRGQLSEKDELIVNLKAELESKMGEIQRVRDSVKSLIGCSSRMALDSLRSEVWQLRQNCQTETESIAQWVADSFQQANTVITDLQNHRDILTKTNLENFEQQKYDLRQAYDSELNQLNAKLVESEADVLRWKQIASEAEESIAAVRAEAVRKLDELGSNLNQESMDKVNGMILEHELELEAIREQCNRDISEKEDEIRGLNAMVDDLGLRMKMAEQEQMIMADEFGKKVEAEANALRARFEQEIAESNKLATDHVTERLKAEHEQAVGALRCELDAANHSFAALKSEHEAQLGRLAIDHQKALSDKIVESNVFHEQRLRELQEKLQTDHKSALEALRQRMKLAYSTQSLGERTPSDPSLEKIERCDWMETSRHEQIVGMLKSDMKDEQERAVAVALEQAERKFGDRLALLSKDWEKEKEESIANLRDQIANEKQVVYSEEVGKVVSEKDSLIEELRNREAALQSELEYQKSLNMKLGLEMSSSQIGSPTGLLSRSIAVLSPTRAAELEALLKTRDDELQKVHQKLLEMSSNQVAAAVVQQDKLSITSCNVGDIVLLCFNDYHDSYVVFTILPILHFLHSDCLGPLSLLPSTEETRKSWVLAEVTDKEYCLARKPINRFKVQMGAKFYRIRAKPWDKENAIRREYSDRRFGMMSTSHVQPLPSRLTADPMTTSTPMERTSPLFTDSNPSTSSNDS